MGRSRSVNEYDPRIVTEEGISELLYGEIEGKKNSDYVNRYRLEEDFDSGSYWAIGVRSYEEH